MVSRIGGSSPSPRVFPETDATDKGAAMARLARCEVIDPAEVSLVHVINRTVRRCFLLGDDSFTGKNFDHRKVWIEELLEQFAACFAIDLLCYAILSNHYHLILRTRPDVVAAWEELLGTEHLGGTLGDRALCRKELLGTGELLAGTPGDRA